MLPSGSNGKKRKMRVAVSDPETQRKLVRGHRNRILLRHAFATLPVRPCHKTNSVVEKEPKVVG